MTYATPVNQTGIMSIFEYANNVTQGTFGVGIPISLYLIIVLYLLMKGEQASDCFIVAGYITGITSVFLLIGGFLSPDKFFIIIGLIIIPAIWAYFNKS